jgi:hypothetical protein
MVVIGVVLVGISTYAINEKYASERAFRAQFQRVTSTPPNTSQEQLIGMAGSLLAGVGVTLYFLVGIAWAVKEGVMRADELRKK